ncbi:MAG: DoxX family membrane protein [Amphritea sp.]
MAVGLCRCCGYSQGIALIVLAFTEKLLNPEMAMRFLAEHNMNFMQLMGVEAYSDYLFVLSAGLAEVLFGVVLILGVVTRTNILALACFMVASNTYFFMMGSNFNAVLEFFGHMPIFAAAIIFIIYGAGDKLTFSFQSIASREQAGKLNRS